MNKVLQTKKQTNKITKNSNHSQGRQITNATPAVSDPNKTLDVCGAFVDPVIDISSFCLACD